MNTKYVDIYVFNAEPSSKETTLYCPETERTPTATASLIYSHIISRDKSVIRSYSDVAVNLVGEMIEKGDLSCDNVNVFLPSGVVVKYDKDGVLREGWEHGIFNWDSPYDWGVIPTEVIAKAQADINMRYGLDSGEWVELTDDDQIYRCAECTCEGGGVDCNWIKSGPSTESVLLDIVTKFRDDNNWTDQESIFKISYSVTDKFVKDLMDVVGYKEQK